VRLSLIDKYMLTIHPIAIGRGCTVFTSRVHLQLQRIKARTGPTCYAYGTGQAPSLKGMQTTVAHQHKTTIIAEPGKLEMLITREFDAPRELVFQALIDPELYVQWLGPRRLTMELDIFEPKSGGRWRYIHRDQSGHEFSCHGVYHEVSAPARIINTFEFEELPAGHVSLETLTLTALPAERTRLIIQSVFQSVADRESALQSGMKEGLSDSHERLRELLAKLQESTR
jgi:uncharacterized protein YndB with AHSA1/START domain